MSSLCLEVRLENFLLIYRNIPHVTTSQPPSTLMFGRMLRTCLDLMKQSLEDTVHRKQLSATLRRTPNQRNSEGETVIVKNYRAGEVWVPGVIQSKTGPLSYTQ